MSLLFTLFLDIKQRLVMTLGPRIQRPWWNVTDAIYVCIGMIAIVVILRLMST